METGLPPRLVLASYESQIIIIFFDPYPYSDYKVILNSSVADPQVFLAAPAPYGQAPGADSGSGSKLLGSAPIPVKKRRFQAASAPDRYTQIFYYKVSKSELLIQFCFSPYLPF